METNHEQKPLPGGEKGRTINIPPGTDLNNGLPPEPAPPPIPDFLPMEDDIFDNLPPLLGVACSRFTDSKERETFLIGALGVLSGMLPNVQGKYAKRMVGANLYCFVIGRYGTGKGALLWAKDLGQVLDNYKQEQARQGVAAYNEAQVQYNRQLALYNKGKLPNPPETPKPPKHLKLYLPANTTKTAVMQLLMENNGRGVMFETEGDTLADMLRQDYGNFSDVLRKAYHHEPVSYFRRADNEDVMIPHPALSVVLSGTQDQLHRLLPGIENGLFSRFCFYILQGDEDFKDPFENEDDDHDVYFGVLAERFMNMYKRLDAMDDTVRFYLQPHQVREFVQHFKKVKSEIREHISSDLDGSIHRMGLITFRIAMILTAVRFIDNNTNRLGCSDKDFRNAIAISRHLVHYTLHVYEGLQYREKMMPKEAAIPDKKQQIEDACRCNEMGMSVREIAEMVLGTPKKHSTVYYWLQKFCGKKSA